MKASPRTWTPSKAALLWGLEWGRHREHLEDRAEDTGEVADALIRQPELLPHQQRYLDAYYLLSPDRSMIAGPTHVQPGAIPTIAIHTMAGIIGEEDELYFLTLIRALDCEYLDYMAKRR